MNLTQQVARLDSHCKPLVAVAGRPPAAPEPPARSPRARSLARALGCVTLLGILGACSGPSRFAVGKLEIRNDGPRLVAVSARWFDGEDGTYHVFEGLMPGGTTGMRLQLDEDLPAGTELRFALEGAGFEELRRRREVEVVGVTSGRFRAQTVAARGDAFGSLFRAAFSSTPPGDELHPVAARWTHPGGPVQLAIQVDADGALKIVRR